MCCFRPFLPHNLVKYGYQLEGRCVVLRLLQRKGLLESSRVLFLSVDAISPNPYQPRRTFSETELAGLAESIRLMGLLQPLTVRRGADGWELVAGERRLRAARMAGLEQVPCLSIHADGQASSLLALVENLQRKDLDFWEESLALQRLIQTFHLSQEDAALRLGRSQSAVANKLRLLKLPTEVLSLLRDGGGTERHARALLKLEDPALQLQTARRVVAEELTVARTEALVEELLAPPPLPQKKRRPTYIIKDVRLFLNTITRSMDLMRSAGVDAQCRREDREDTILLTIQIPRRVAR